MYKYILISIGILIGLTLVGNAIACSVINNPNSVECYYIVYGGITLMVVGTLITAIFYLIYKIKEREKKNQESGHYSPRIVVKDYPINNNPLRSKKKRTPTNDITYNAKSERV